MKLILLGPPGAGKGTQAAKIAERYSLAHISTGDMLRAEIALKTPLGSKAKSLIDKGELVPDDIIVGMVQNRITQPDCENGFLLDGFPRTIAQAEALMAFCKPDKAICITVPNEAIVGRMAKRRVCPACKRTYSTDDLSAHYVVEGCAVRRTHYCGCGHELGIRDDDKPETVLQRLNVYEQQTMPLIEFFESRGLLARVDGNDTVDAVAQSIFEVLDN